MQMTVAMMDNCKGDWKVVWKVAALVVMKVSVTDNN